MMRKWTKTLASLSLVLALFAAFCTTSLAERQDAATPAEERTSSFAGQEPGELRVIKINGVSYRFRWAPPGTFTMGSPEKEQEEEYRFRETDMIATNSAGPSEEDFKVLRESVVEETRQHEVTLTHGFWMLETEVTQPMWESIMGDNPSCFKGADLPVEQVSWIDCQKFVNKLNDLGFAPAGSCCALPTEAQWEYACRAGTTTAYSWGDSLSGDHVNHPGGTDVNGKFLPQTTSVGSYAANPWGLFDMHGNVMEWCEDRFGAYPVDAVTDLLNSDSGWNRVMRGGSWTSPVEFYGSARRHSLSVDARFCGNGFRFVLIPLAEEIGQGEEAPAQDDATPAEEWTASFDGEEAGDRRVIDVDGVFYSFRWAPPGTFTMGSPETEEGRADDEAQQEVALTRGFWILETEVTQLMWKSLMRYNPSAFDGADLPVELVSWNDCQEFIGKLNDRGFAPAGSRFALPTEAQWEYACRAGTTTAFSWGDSFTGSEANCSGSRPQRTNAKWEFLGRTTPVDSYAANPWGLVDMHGNVSEWCEDEPTAEVVMEARAVSADSGRFRAQRGGDIVSRSLSCRSASRSFNDADSLYGYCGFRIVLVPLSE